MRLRLKRLLLATLGTLFVVLLLLLVVPDPPGHHTLSGGSQYRPQFRLTGKRPPSRADGEGSSGHHLVDEGMLEARSNPPGRIKIKRGKSTHKRGAARQKKAAPRHAKRSGKRKRQGDALHPAPVLKKRKAGGRQKRRHYIVKRHTSSTRQLAMDEQNTTRDLFRIGSLQSSHLDDVSADMGQLPKQRYSAATSNDASHSLNAVDVNIVSASSELLSTAVSILEAQAGHAFLHSSRAYSLLDTRKEANFTSLRLRDKPLELSPGRHQALHRFHAAVLSFTLLDERPATQVSDNGDTNNLDGKARGAVSSEAGIALESSDEHTTMDLDSQPHDQDENTVEQPSHSSLLSKQESRNTTKETDDTATEEDNRRSDVDYTTSEEDHNTTTDTDNTTTKEDPKTTTDINNTTTEEDNNTTDTNKTIPAEDHSTTDTNNTTTTEDYNTPTDTNNTITAENHNTTTDTNNTTTADDYSTTTNTNNATTAEDHNTTTDTNNTTTEEENHNTTTDTNNTIPAENHNTPTDTNNTTTEEDYNTSSDTDYTITADGKEADDPHSLHKREAEEPGALAPSLAQELRQAVVRSLLLSPPWSERRSLGGEAELSCRNDAMKKFKAQVPLKKTQWLLNGEALKVQASRMLFRGDDLLVIQDLRATDTGVYECRVDYGEPRALTLAVFALTVTSPLPTLLPRLTEEVTLQCHGQHLARLLFAVDLTLAKDPAFGCQPPDCAANNVTARATRHWFHNGSRPPSSPGPPRRQQVGAGESEGQQPGVSGVWRCEVRHPTGGRVWNTTWQRVFVKDPPSALELWWRSALRRPWIVSLVGTVCLVTCMGLSGLVARHAQKKDENLEVRWQAMKTRMMRKASRIGSFESQISKMKKRDSSDSLEGGSTSDSEAGKATPRSVRSGSGTERLPSLTGSQTSKVLEVTASARDL